MRARAIVLVLAVVVTPAAADVRVQQDGELLNVEASGAPVSEVLDRLARQTGMQVVYEGAPPRLPVTLSIARRTPAEAVFSVLDGLGLNYALRLDESGGRVHTLVMAGVAAPSAPAAGARGEAPPQPENRDMPLPYPPPPSYPQEPGEGDFDPNAGVIPPPPPQPPQEFTITPPQPQPEPQEQRQPSYVAPTLGAGFSSPFNGGGFSTPGIIGNPPPEPPPGGMPPPPPPGEPPPEEKEP